MTTPLRPSSRPGVGRRTISISHGLLALAKTHGESWSRAASEGMVARLTARGVDVPEHLRAAPDTPQDHTLRPSVVEALVRAGWTPETLHVAAHAPVELEAALRRLRGIGETIAGRLVERARTGLLRQDGRWPGEVMAVAANRRGRHAAALAYIRERDPYAARTL